MSQSTPKKEGLAIPLLGEIAVERPMKQIEIDAVKGVASISSNIDPKKVSTDEPSSKWDTALSTTVAGAQSPGTDQDANKENPAQQTDKRTLSAIIPDAPNVIKRQTDKNMISIPVERAITSTGKRGVAPTVIAGSRFGYRSDPFTGGARFHSGVDIKARSGDTVGASQPGIVVFAGWYYGYGNMVIVSHGSGITTRYAHLSSIAVEVGERVERGQIIARAGSTGRATSPHLHYEVRVDGSAINPFQVLALDPSSDYFKQQRAYQGATN
ncbi:MAG TPA: M23 family metallopeptidase [Blastocatellia bacterium]|nr:M23 family metallopeptidase [Blastocatellia bacterium]